MQRFRILPCIILMIVALSSDSGAAPWRFVVLGDGRGNGIDQINIPMTTEIANATIAEDADLLLFAGDLASWGDEAAYRSWTNIMAAVYDAGIGVFPIRGNHELFGDPDGTQWQNVFSTLVPTNGPAGEVAFTYSFTNRNALFIGLDAYVATNQINQAWLDDQLASNKLPHVFVYSHPAAFKVLHYDCMDDHPAERNVFWSSLTNAGAMAYFCGHDHFYDHARIDDGDGNPSNDVHQFEAGTAGAPPYPEPCLYDGDNGSWTPVNIHHEVCNGYILGEVDGGDVTLMWKHRVDSNVFEVADTLTYAAPFAPKLTLAVPAAAKEGDGPVTGVVSVASAVVSDLQIALVSSDTTEVTFTNSVVIPAGQSNVAFEITIVNDPELDGTQTVNIKASNEGYASGRASLPVHDNDSATLSVSLPAGATEGDGILAGAGQVFVSAPVDTNVPVALASSKTTELTVPSVVIIPAGQTNAAFDLNIADDTELDGPRLVGVSAHVENWTDGSNTISVADNEAHHFAFAPVASPQFAGAPFSATISARDTNDETITVYRGSAFLSATGDVGPVAIQPTNTTAFINGVWTGSIVAGTLATNVRLVADDGMGRTGTSSWFNVLAWPVDHFVWAGISSPQTSRIPFSVSITAKDGANNTATGFTGIAALSGFVDALDTNHTMLTDTSYSGSLVSSVTRGLRFISSQDMTLTHFRLFSGSKASIWTDAGVLLASKAISGATGVWTEVALDTPLQLSSGTVYRIGFYSGGSRYWYETSATPFAFAHGTVLDGCTANGDNFPAGATNVKYLVDMRYGIVASTPAPVSPGNSGNFVAGVWTGDVSVLGAGSNAFLRADDGIGHSGDSGLFDLWSTYLVMATAGPHGAVSPSGNVVVAQGVGTSFVVTADAHCYVGNILTNGVSIGGSFGMIGTNYMWSNIVADGSFDAVFGEELATNAVPVWWLASYDLTNRTWDTEALDDQDSDSMFTWEEFIAGTCPTNGAEYLKIAQIYLPSQAQSAVGFMWQTVTGRFYRVITATNLLSVWTNVPNRACTNIPGTGLPVVYTNETQPDQIRFFRIKVRKP